MRLRKPFPPKEWEEMIDKRIREHGACERREIWETLLQRYEYLEHRIRFLDTIPKKMFGHVYPNTLPYNVTFDEMDDINDKLTCLDRYIDDVCHVCGKMIGWDTCERHHISYYPETIILVHCKCHQKIHHTNLYTHLKPPVGDSKDFYNGVKKPANRIESGIIGTELKVTYLASASCYPQPNLNWNRAAKTAINVEYIVCWYKVIQSH